MKRVHLIQSRDDSYWGVRNEQGMILFCPVSGDIHQGCGTHCALFDVETRGGEAGKKSINVALCRCDVIGEIVSGLDETGKIVLEKDDA